MARITTIEAPLELPVAKKGEHWYARAGDRELRLSNLDKVYWPDDGYTKGDLLTYYYNVSPVMLPHVIDRPLTLKRMPDGLAGGFFYEKNAPSHTPEWMPRLRVEADGKQITYLTVRDVAHMLYIANLGCIEFHPLHAKGLDQQHPTYAFFDLDPFEPATFEDVAHVAQLIKVVLDRLELPAYPKTSGATGMQIMVPLDRGHTYDQARAFVGGVAQLVRAADPDSVTLEWEVGKRAGKVFIDVNMNRAGANIAAAYSVRPEPGATVSAPVTWEELPEVAPSDFTMATMHARIAEVGDLFAPVAEGPGCSLTGALGRLGVSAARSGRSAGSGSRNK